MSVFVPLSKTPMQDNAKKFVLWAAIGSICMFFIGLSSALIVKRIADDASGTWMHFVTPKIFFVSTVLIMLSSGTLLFAKRFYSQGNQSAYKMSMLLTSILGTGFIVCQYLGWKALVQIGVYVGGATANASGSFFYVISGAHALHIVGGLFPLYYLTFKSYTKSLPEQPQNTLQMMSIYWHFVDVLWLYLFALLIF